MIACLQKSMRSVARIGLVLFIAASPIAPGYAQDAATVDQYRYKLRFGLFQSGTYAGANEYPLDKAYPDFSAQEKARYRSQYEDLRDGDEPPYLIDGMEDVTLGLRELISRRGVEGELIMFVTVNEQGKATSFDILATPDKDAATYAAGLVLREKFHPGMCAGRPCVMQWPLRVNLRLSE